ncbi:carboxypeptidase-like regulatory domain-containing protein [Janthinobacterium agaricidamnosum]|uniref:Putative exported protein n=1 Tax=Janthinobacterium agaricidamnosum NBRC 102515 = DSM 9628 TaxID=1349767 RepID=W0VD14_9BURK|nr:carboxypeptidase-like regulatory domain-containing protein [Janthinobacterium agaricidamnosum]CDG85268.1 putative exported protein [Janthinobacterium agaricidamnosum NBRC 102515 = DSM 9628]
MTHWKSKAAAAAMLGMLCSGAALAQSDSALPAIHKSGAVEYLSGGIGLDESTAIKSASKSWPLTLEFSVQSAQRAQFASDVKVEVHDAKGVLVLQATAGGPYLLARLAPGSYRLQATLAGKSLQRQVRIKAGAPARVVLVWPAGTNQGQP